MLVTDKRKTVFEKVCALNLDRMDPLISVVMRRQLSKIKKITSFASIGCYDPTDHKLGKQARKKLENLVLEDDVYEDRNGAKRPPKCIFLPDKKLLRTMISEVLTFNDKESREEFLMKFGLMPRKYEKRFEKKMDKVKFSIQKLKNMVKRKKMLVLAGCKMDKI